MSSPPSDTWAGWHLVMQGSEVAWTHAEAGDFLLALSAAHVRPEPPRRGEGDASFFAPGWRLMAQEATVLQHDAVCLGKIVSGALSMHHEAAQRAGPSGAKSIALSVLACGSGTLQLCFANGSALRVHARQWSVLPPPGATLWASMAC